MSAKPQPDALLGFPKDLRGKTTFDGLVFTKQNYQVTDENDVANRTYADTSLDTKVPNQSVGTAQVVNDAVTSDKLQDGGISSSSLATSAITTAKLADSAITGDKIPPSNVTEVKLANSAVSGSKIQPGIITSAYIGDASVTSSFFSAGSVTTAKLANNVARNANIANSAVSAGKIAPSSITASMIETNAISTAAIQDNSIPSSSITNAQFNWTGVDFTNLTTDRWTIVHSDTNGFFLRMEAVGEDFSIYNSSTDLRSKNLLFDNTATSTPSTTDNSLSIKGYIGSAGADIASFSARGKGVNMIVNQLPTKRFVLFENTLGTDLLQVQSGGGIINSTGTYGALSDARLKTDITPIGSHWEKFKSLRFVKYRLKEEGESGSVYMGLIAQEAEKIYPEVVKEDSSSGMKTVDLAAIGIRALAALQETIHRIDKLVEKKKEAERPPAMKFMAL